MKTSKSYLLVLIVCSLSCGQKSSGSVAEVTQLIQDNLYIEAADMTARLLEDDPDDPELLFLAGFAALGETLDQLNFLTTLIAPLVDSAAIADITSDEKTRLDSAAVVDENQFILDILAGAVTFLREPAVRAVDHLSKLDPADFRFEFSHLTMRFWQTEFFEFSGIWDGADIALLLAMVGPWAAGLDIVAAHDLNVDVYFAVHRIIGVNPANSVPEFGNLIVQLMETPDYPNFLGLKSGVGIDTMAEARTHLRSGMAALGEFSSIAIARSEGVGIFELTESEDRKSIRLDNRVRQDQDGNFDLSFRVNPDASFQTVEIQFPDSLVQAAAAIASNLENDAGTESRLSIEGHLLPLLVPPVLGLLDHVQLSDTIDSAIGLIGRDPESATKLIGSIVPDGLELDLVAWFTSGKGLRDLLPVYRTDLAPLENNFLIEWECPLFFTPSITHPVGSTSVYPGSFDCPNKNDAGFESHASDDFDLDDSAHFETAAFSTLDIDPIAKDGLESAWPIVAFNDPTMGGVIYIDGSKVLEADPVPTSSQVADNRLLNAWISALYSSVSSFF